MSDPFVEELSLLLSAPYAYLYIVTHDEARAVAVVSEQAAQAQRPVREWTTTAPGPGGPQAQTTPTDPVTALAHMLDQIERETEPVVYILKDPRAALTDPWIVRRLRDMEPMLAAFGKSVVMLGPSEVRIDELATDLTVLHMPVPGRAPIGDISNVVFPPQHWPNLDRDGLVSGALGLTSRQALRAFHRVRMEWKRAHGRGEAFDPVSAMLAEKRRLVQAVDVVEFVDADQGLGDVGGLDELKLWLQARREAFSPRARAFGLPSPKGLLMLGVQGCGKSLMAKVVAHFWSMPLLRLDVASVFAGHHPPDAAMRMAIETATAVSPSVLWVDELEKLFDPGADASDGSSRILGSLLTWLQEKSEPVFFVATANRVDRMPPELMRKGRFDEIFFVDLPDRRSRAHILNIHLKRHSRDPANFDVQDLSVKTRNFSGAELEQVVVAGLYEAFGHERALTQEDLEVAVQRTVPLFQTYQEEIKALREWASERARSASRDSSLLDYFGSKR